MGGGCVYKVVVRWVEGRGIGEIYIYIYILRSKIDD